MVVRVGCHCDNWDTGMVVQASELEKLVEWYLKVMVLDFDCIVPGLVEDCVVRSS